jgi:hypothetical protein
LFAHPEQAIEEIETANELIKESELSISGISFREKEEEE